MVVSGALTKNCMRDVRELYGLPSHDAEATSAASASLLLELYDEVPPLLSLSHLKNHLKSFPSLSPTRYLLHTVHANAEHHA